MMDLTAENVTAVLLDCMFKDDELTEEKLPKAGIEYIIVEGVVANFGFVRTRLESHRQDVVDFISQLHPNFLSAAEGGGDGWSFLQLPFKGQDNEQWGEQMSAQELYVLAKGLKLAKDILPRPMWIMFEGGVPYIRFSKTEFPAEQMAVLTIERR